MNLNFSQSAYELINRFQPPLDQTYARLRALKSRYGRWKLAFLIGVDPKSIDRWLRKERTPCRRSQGTLRLLAVCPAAVIEAVVEDRLIQLDLIGSNRGRKKASRKPKTTGQT